jgi:hypothetical protein
MMTKSKRTLTFIGFGPNSISRSLFAILLVTVSLGGLCCGVQAQGLLWQLPEDEVTVHYQGTYKQQVFSRVTDDADPKEIEWIRDLFITAGPREEHQVDGVATQCRKLKIVVRTGKAFEGANDPGPVGEWTYEVLIAESAVLGQIADERDIPVSFIPILEGTRKAGDKPAEPIKATNLQIYPTISLLRHYSELKPAGTEPEELDIPFGFVNARKFTASHTLESRTSRSVNNAEIWKSSDVPFGLAKWTVRLSRERKSDLAPRSKFKTVTRITVEMEAQKPE